MISTHVLKQYYFIKDVYSQNALVINSFLSQFSISDCYLEKSANNNTAMTNAVHIDLSYN